MRSWSSLSAAGKTFSATSRRKSRRHHRLGVVPHEGVPSAGSATRASRVQVLAHRARRDPEAQLDSQFISDSFLAPGWVLPIHLIDQFPEVLRKQRTATLTGFPAPEYPKSGSVPADEGLWFNDDQCRSPIEEARQEEDGQALCSRSSPRFYLALSEQSQLFSEEQILGHEGSTRAAGWV